MIAPMKYDGGETKDLVDQQALAAMGFKKANIDLGPGVEVYTPSGESLEEIFGAPISTYTRRQAIADGVLVELVGRVPESNKLPAT